MSNQEVINEINTQISKVNTMIQNHRGNIDKLEEELKQLYKERQGLGGEPAPISLVPSPEPEQEQDTPAYPVGQTVMASEVKTTYKENGYLEPPNDPDWLAVERTDQIGLDGKASRGYFRIFPIPATVKDPAIDDFKFYGRTFPISIKDKPPPRWSLGLWARTLADPIEMWKQIDRCVAARELNILQWHSDRIEEAVKSLGQWSGAEAGRILGGIRGKNIDFIPYYQQVDGYGSIKSGEYEEGNILNDSYNVSWLVKNQGTDGRIQEIITSDIISREQVSELQEFNETDLYSDIDLNLEGLPPGYTSFGSGFLVQIQGNTHVAALGSGDLGGPVINDILVGVVVGLYEKTGYFLIIIPYPTDKEISRDTAKNSTMYDGWNIANPLVDPLDKTNSAQNYITEHDGTHLTCMLCPSMKFEVRERQYVDDTVHYYGFLPWFPEGSYGRIADGFHGRQQLMRDKYIDSMGIDLETPNDANRHTTADLGNSHFNFQAYQSIHLDTSGKIEYNGFSQFRPPNLPFIPYRRLYRFLGGSEILMDKHLQKLQDDYDQQLKDNEAKKQETNEYLNSISKKLYGGDVRNMTEERTLQLIQELGHTEHAAVLTKVLDGMGWLRQYDKYQEDVKRNLERDKNAAKLQSLPISPYEFVFEGIRGSYEVAPPIMPVSSSQNTYGGKRIKQTTRRKRKTRRKQTTRRKRKTRRKQTTHRKRKTRRKQTTHRKRKTRRK